MGILFHMCYAKPGPRCDSEARKRLDVAEKAYAANPSDQNEKRLKHRRHDFFLTKDGIQHLRDEGRSDFADQFEKKRENLIQESKFLADRSSRGKWSDIPLKEMDPGALSMALMEASEDETIDWGTSSPERFQRAINAATFWHRDQTRANRAGFPRTPYIEHPLRNALRAYRLGCTDGETLTAIVLHDTIEDCAHKIAGNKDLDAHEARAEATRKLTAMFGENTVHIVSKVSTPIPDKPLSKPEKRIWYRDHVENTIHEPKVFVTKFVDFADNAGGLHHNYIKGQEGMVISMYTKYSMAMPVFKEAYEKVRHDLPVGSTYKLRAAIASVERNLNRLGERLREDGHVK